MSSMSPMRAIRPLRLIALVTASLLALGTQAVAATSSSTGTAVASPRPQIVETTFSSVDAVVAGQWEFPQVSPAPLVVMIQATTGVDRHGLPPGYGDDPEIGIYDQLAKKLVAAGFAVFRFDQPGTGRSGRGNYATARSTALEAYTRAIDHARVDPTRVFLFSHSRGTDAIAGIYARYQEINPVAGVMLLSNQVGETDIVRVACPALLLVTDKNPDDLYQFGQFPTQARQRSEASLETSLVTIPDAEQSLLTTIEEGDRHYYSIHPKAVEAILEWLQARHAVVVSS
ncbi:MAG: alpha/beta superfamily hydrolase [Hyphomicrobiaceae bacterium]|jgi:alpha/beta superfamily hydrolase